jgi:type III secretory pathway component EscT
VSGFDLDAQALCVSALLCARVLPLAAVTARAALRGAPLLSVVLALVLVLCLYPSAAAAAPALPANALALLALSLRELLIGLVYALALALPLVALGWSGWLSGRFAAVPGSEAALATLQRWFGLAAFFALGGQRVALSVIAHGLSARPLGSLTVLSGTGPALLGAVRLFADAFASALLLALPIGAALLLSELGLVLSARAASAPFAQLVLPPARAALLLLVVCIGVLLLSAVLPNFFRHGLLAAARLLGEP